MNRKDKFEYKTYSYLVFIRLPRGDYYSYLEFLDYNYLVGIPKRHRLLERVRLLKLT